MAKKKSTKKTGKKAAPKKAAKKKTAKKAAPKKAVKKAVKPARPAGGKVAPKKAAVKVAPKKVLAKKEAPKSIKKTVGINPYLTFNGNCEEAFNFYKSVFGGSFPYVGRYGEMPSPDGQPIPSSEKNKIMHMSLPIGANSILMGSDSSDAFGHATVIGDNFSISINTTSQDEADKLYNGLSNEGIKTMPMSKTFWGSYFGMLVDKFGINWQISFDTPKK